MLDSAGVDDLADRLLIRDARLYTGAMGARTCSFEVKEPTAKTSVLITAQDGQRFELQLALIVLGVADQGIINPLDGLPLFQVASQIVMQVGRQVDG